MLPAAPVRSINHLMERLLDHQHRVKGAPPICDDEMVPEGVRGHLTRSFAREPGSFIPTGKN
jgi:hypothetical protein